MKVIFCTPTLKPPLAPYFDALEASVPLLDAAGIEHGITFETGNVYISNAMATLLRRALDAKPDVVVFLDYDVSWKPRDLLTLIETPGDVVAGTYRFKNIVEEYMAQPELLHNGTPVVRDDGCVEAVKAPSGFLKITRGAVNRFMKAYPNLVYGEPCYPHVDLFNHGAIDGTWYGQDYGFCKRWRDAGEKVWINPFLSITHHMVKPDGSLEAFRGKYQNYLCTLPGGSSDPDRLVHYALDMLALEAMQGSRGFAPPPGTAADYTAGNFPVN